MTITDPRLVRETVRVPRRDNYENRPVLSATIHPDIKRTLVAMSERTGMTVSQVTDEVLFTGLVLGAPAANANIWRVLGYARATAAMMERLEGLEGSKQ